MGEPAEDMYDMIEVVNMILPQSKPRYLMGVGTPLDMLDAVREGIDLFDCVAPTRNARNGALYTKKGRLNILNSIRYAW